MTIFAADFQNAAYSLSGVACALADILTENADWGSWNPGDVVSASGVGFVMGANCLPTFTSAIIDAAQSGITLVGTCSLGADATSGIFVEFNDAPTYSTENAVSLKNGETKVSTLAGSDVVSGPGAGSHKFACNISPTRMAISVDGGDVVARDVPSTTFTLLCMGAEIPGEVSYLHTLTGQSAVAEADLPALSV